MSHIDAHVHIWTDDFVNYPLEPGSKKERLEPPTALPEEMLAHSRACGVQRVVLVQVSYYGYDNTYMLETIRQHPEIFSGIGAVDPQAEKPDLTMRRLAGQGVRGFRIAPWGKPPETWLDGAGYERMFRAGADDNLALCPLIGTEALPALERRCAQFPDTPIIIDHLCLLGAGSPVTDEQLDRLCSMAGFPKIMVKVSAFYALGRKKPPYLDLIPTIKRIYEAFGAERLMWASDSPFQLQGEHTYANSLELIRDHLSFLSIADRKQMLGGTAESFFFSR